MALLLITLKWLLGSFMVVAGIFHLYRPKPFVKIMPPLLPNPLFLVYLSGVFEILLGGGLLVPASQSVAAWGLMGLFIAIFPANVYMAIHRISVSKKSIAPWMLWARLPLQGVFIYWAYLYTEPAK